MRLGLMLVLCAFLVACGGDSPTGPSGPPPPLFVRSGSGNQVFDLPSHVKRLRIRGAWNLQGTSNFIVTVGGQLTVNVVLRDSLFYDGTHQTPGGAVQITSSENISWIFDEVR